MSSATLVVLVTLVAMATAGVVVPNRPYAAPYQGYNYGSYPNYKAAPYAANKGYAYAPVKSSRNVYDYPYDNYGYNYKPAAVAVTPVKKVVDPYPYYYDYRGTPPYAYQPVKKVADPYPAKAVFPARKGFTPFSSKSVVAPVNKFQDPYPYGFGAQKSVYPVPAKAVFPAAPVKSVFPAKKVADPYPYSYQPNFGARKVVDPFPAKGAVYPVQKVVDPYRYPAQNAAYAYNYPSKSAYPVRNVGNAYPYDPYYAGVKRAVPPKTAVAPVVKKAAPEKKSTFGGFSNFANFGDKGFGKGFFDNFKF